MAAHSSILTWTIPWTEEPRGQPSIGSQTVRHNWSTLACMYGRNPIGGLTGDIIPFPTNPLWVSCNDALPEPSLCQMVKKEIHSQCPFTAYKCRSQGIQKGTLCTYFLIELTKLIWPSACVKLMYISGLQPLWNPGHSSSRLCSKDLVQSIIVPVANEAFIQQVFVDCLLCTRHDFK